MSHGVNKVILLGNVGSNLKIHLMPGGDKVAKFSLATSESWKDKQTGEQQQRTEWHYLVCFGGLAKIVENYVQKGSKLYIEGSVRNRSFEQDGVKRYTTEIVASEVKLLDSKQESQPTPPIEAYQDYGQQPQQPQQQQPQQQQQQQTPRGYNDNGTQKSPYQTNLQSN